MLQFESPVCMSINSCVCNVDTGAMAASIHYTTPLVNSKSPVFSFIVMLYHKFGIRRRSDYITGFITPAIGPNKSKKPTRLIALAHNKGSKVWMKNNIHGFTVDNCLSVKPCMLFFIQTLLHILCAGTISHVSFFDLFGLIAGAINPII